MTHSDELVERVKEMILSAYLDMDASDLAKRMNAGMSAREALRLSLNGIIPEVISAYRHAALSALPGHELLRDALRIIAAHEVVAPLTQNDDNVSLSDLPFYVAGKAHAELAILHNIARNALDAYEVGAAAEKLRAELGVG